MAWKNYVFSNYIGQEKIKRRFIKLLDKIKEGENYNILFIGPAGIGKTFLAKLGLLYLDKDFQFSIYYFAGDKVLPYHGYKYHLYDEIHILKEPEYLYPYLDQGSDTYIFTSNEYDLKSSLLTRCIILPIIEYTNEEIKQIIQKDLSCSEELSEYIYSFLRVNNPRVVKKLVEEIKVYSNEYTMGEIEYVMGEILERDQDGFSPLERRYLDFIRQQERASLNTICNTLNIPKNYVLREIEPILISRGLVKITSRGRVYVKET